MAPFDVVVSCEHAGNRIPARYTKLFTNARKVLDGHRGYDIGALHVARQLALRLHAPLLSTNVSRLVIDVNRSLHHPTVFSEFTRALDPVERRRIIAEYYESHRNAVKRAISDALSGGKRVLHIGVHSFTPSLHDVDRNAEVGLLYDPKRTREMKFSVDWQRCIEEFDATLRVRRNYPYRGNADGLTTALREDFPEDRYLGIELECNQRCLQDPADGVRVRAAVIRALAGMID